MESNIFERALKLSEKAPSGKVGKSSRSVRDDVRMYRSSALDNYDTMDYGDEGYEEYKTKAWSEDANAYITDKEGNEYPVELSMWSSDAGSYANAVKNYKAVITLGPDTKFEKHDYYSGFLSSHECDDRLYYDILEGIYLEDYIAKHGDYCIRGPEANKFKALGAKGDKNARTTKQIKDEKEDAKYDNWRANNQDIGCGVSVKIKNDGAYLHTYRGYDTKVDDGPIMKILKDAISGTGFKIEDFENAIFKFKTNTAYYNHIVFDKKSQSLNLVPHRKDNPNIYDIRKATPIEASIESIDLSKCTEGSLAGLITKYRKDKKAFFANVRDDLRKAHSTNLYFKGGKDSYGSYNKGEAWRDATNLYPADYWDPIVSWEDFIALCESISGKTKNDDPTVEIVPEENTEKEVKTFSLNDINYGYEDIEKCDKWHSTGRRNIKAMDDSKLKRTAAYCKKAGYKAEYDKCIDELESRGFAVNESYIKNDLRSFRRFLERM